MGRLIHVEINFLKQCRCTALRAGMPICSGRVRYGSGIINSDDVSIINWREQAGELQEGRGRDGAINSALPPPTSLSTAEAKIEPISHLNLRPASERRALLSQAFVRTARSSCGKRCCCRAGPFSIISTPRVRSRSGVESKEERGRAREADRKQTIRRTHERSTCPFYRLWERKVDKTIRSHGNFTWRKRLWK